MQSLLLRLNDAHTPQNDGCLNFVDENDEVLISGFGRRGKAKGDIPGVRFKIVKVSGVGLLALWKEKKVCAIVTDTSASSNLRAGEAKIINGALSNSYLRFYPRCIQLLQSLCELEAV